jgi:hypothetical protein
MRERLITDGMAAAALWVFAENARARVAYERLDWRFEPGCVKSFALRRWRTRALRYRTEFA